MGERKDCHYASSLFMYFSRSDTLTLYHIIQTLTPQKRTAFENIVRIGENYLFSKLF